MTRTSFAISEESVARELLVESESNWEELTEEHFVCATTTRSPSRLQHQQHLHDADDTVPNINSVDNKEYSFDLFKEAALLFHIALPSVLIQFSQFFVFPQAASVVGTQLSTVDLAGFSLGSLIGNLTCLSIMEGSLTACDTLMPRAFANQQYAEVVRLAIRALVVCTLLLLPPMVPLCCCADTLLIWLNQDVQASRLAQTWIQYYFIGVFPNLIFRVALRFVLAQNQPPWHYVVSSILPSVFLCPVLLRHFVPSMGLAGSALAIAMTQWSMLLVLLLVCSCNTVPVCHYPEITWPKLTKQLIQESLALQPLCNFFSLSLGGVLSLSEWWFWEAMCFVAGSFGVVSLCVHTIAYNLVPLLFMLPLGIMIGLAVRMGHVIAYDPRRAQLLAMWCMGLIVVVGGIVATGFYALRRQIIRLFTADEQVMDGCLHIWPYVCCYIFLLYIFGISNAIYRGLGMQWRLAIIVTISLYMFLFPMVIYFAVIQQGGLYAQWRILPSFYVIMQFALVAGYVTVDWNGHSIKIRKGMQSSTRMSEDIADDETSRLLP
jgi:MATE family multidrug resistance protein